jgi:hypothetical protein
MTPRFNEILKFLTENLKGDLFQKQKRKFPDKPSNSSITNNQELIQRVYNLFPLAVRIDLDKPINRGTVKSTEPKYNDYNLSQDRSNALAENWSTMLFRGHKVLNPFSKTGDSKAKGNAVYWAKDPHNALIYALNQSSWGTSGQQYSNVIQRASQDLAKGDSAQKQYAFGYITIAQPKYPEKLKWYKNFGVEDEEQQYQQAVKAAREKHEKENPHKLFTGLPPNYKHQNTYGMTKDQWGKESERQKAFITSDPQKFDKEKAEWKTKYAQQGVPYEGSKVIPQAEAALSPDQVSKVRTYLVFNKNSMISVENIKKHDPILYNVLLNDSL